MVWSIPEGSWLAQVVLGGTIVLTLGSLAARACRQPAHRARVVLLTVVGSLFVPWLGALPFVPRWSAGRVPVAAIAGPVERSFGVPLMPPITPTPGLIADPRPIGSGRSVEPSAESGEVAPVVPPRVPSRISWRLLAIGAYLTVAAGLAAWWVLGQATLLGIARSSRPVSPGVRDRFLAISGPLGERVRLIESDRIALPFTFTWVRPTILLPVGLGRHGDTEELRYALAHEWSHVERRDYWAWTLTALAGLLLFYQPLFWWLRRQLRLSQDYLADDRAASVGSPEAYASYLIRLARRRVAGPSLPALGIGDRRSNLHRRVVMLVQDRDPWERRCRTLWAFAAAIVAAGVMVVASGIRLDASPIDDAPKALEKPPKADEPVAKTPAPGAREWTGTIVDKETGRPIAGSRVNVRIGSSRDPQTNGWRDYRNVISETAADGQYRFTISPEEAAHRFLYVTLEVDQPDHVRYYGGYSYAMILKNETLGERPFYEKLEVWPAKAIEGRVVDPEGQPAQGIKVQTYSSPSKKGLSLNGGFGEVWTDAQGHFRLPVHREGEAVFWVLPERFAPSIHPLKNDKRGDQGTIRLAKGISVRGRVTDAQGKPVGKAYVGLDLDPKTRSDEDGVPQGVADMMHRVALTADDGTFSVGPMPAGTYRIVPNETGWDPVTRAGDKNPERRPLPAVFTAQTVVLKEGEEPEPVEIRAVPNVVVELQMYNSKHEKKPGHQVWISGQIDGGHWSGEYDSSPEGTYTMLVPHGLEDAQVMLMTNEHSALLFRKTKDAPLERDRNIMLGTLDHDVKGVELVRFVAPLILIKAKSKDGLPVKDAKVSVIYVEKTNEGMHFSNNGMRSDISLENQGPGVFRTTQLAPDREVVVTVQADGFELSSRNFKLPEGKTEEVEMILAPK